MHIPTHIIAGWCVASLLRLTPRERMFAMVAAGAADLDGISIIAGEEWYWRTHHILGHNLLVGMLLSLGLTIYSTYRTKAMLLYLFVFHLHLAMDFWGSGPGWMIHYLWPFDNRGWKTHQAWPLTSWQNTAAAAALLLWTLWIALKQGRSPLENIMPDLDRRFVLSFRRMMRWRSGDRSAVAQMDDTARTSAAEENT
jgi:inner membrane protein